MATQILATDDTEATSTEINVASGETVTIGIKGATAGASLDVEIESDEGWVKFDSLANVNGQMVKVIAGPGNYRLVRAAGVTCGAFSA